MTKLELLSEAYLNGGDCLFAIKDLLLEHGNTALFDKINMLEQMDVISVGHIQQFKFTKFPLLGYWSQEKHILDVLRILVVESLFPDKRLAHKLFYYKDRFQPFRDVDKRLYDCLNLHNYPYLNILPQECLSVSTEGNK